MASPDYISYKKKQQSLGSKQRRNVHETKLKIFVGTFIVIFAAVAFLIKNYSSKLDIEMNYGPYGVNKSFEETLGGQIDARLKQLQADETLPSVSKSAQQKDEMEQVMDVSQIDEFKEDKEELKEEIEQFGQEVKKETEQIEHVEKSAPTPQRAVAPTPVKTTASPKIIKTSTGTTKMTTTAAPVRTAPKPPSAPKVNSLSTITTKTPQIKPYFEAKPEPTVSLRTSKVVVGNYATDDEARAMQIKLMNTGYDITPFVKKFNGMYTVQVGSFANPASANGVAGQLNQVGYPARVIRE